MSTVSITLTPYSSAVGSQRYWQPEGLNHPLSQSYWRTVSHILAADTIWYEDDGSGVPNDRRFISQIMAAAWHYACLTDTGSGWGLCRWQIRCCRTGRLLTYTPLLVSFEARLRSRFNRLSTSATGMPSSLRQGASVNHCH